MTLRRTAARATHNNSTVWANWPNVTAFRASTTTSPIFAVLARLPAVKSVPLARCSVSLRGVRTVVEPSESPTSMD